MYAHADEDAYADAQTRLGIRATGKRPEDGMRARLIPKRPAACRPSSGARVRPSPRARGASPLPGTGLERLIPHADVELVELMKKLIRYDPDERILARQALKAPRDLGGLGGGGHRDGFPKPNSPPFHRVHAPLSGARPGFCRMVHTRRPSLQACAPNPSPAGSAFLDRLACDRGDAYAMAADAYAS